MIRQLRIMGLISFKLMKMTFATADTLYKYNNTRMGLKLQVTLFFLLLCLGLAYEKVGGQDELLRFHEEYSEFPIVHIYHNRHFSRSNFFQDFLEVIEETEERCGDYAKFLLTDCEEFKEGEAMACDEMQRNKESRSIYGYFPEGKFLSYAGKKMQNPPGHRRLNHPSDVFAVHQMEHFIEEMLPNFFQELSNEEDYLEWLNVRHTPKLVFVSRDGLDDVPNVLKMLSVTFFLRFDFGFLSDLTESVVKHFNMTAVPFLGVLEYNYESGIYELSEWQGTDFSNLQYLPLRDFLDPLARPEPRNDLIFHKMGALPDRGIVQVESKVKLDQVLDQADGWTIISATKGEPLQLKMLKERYGRFLQYVHHRTENQTETIQMFNPENHRVFELKAGEIKFKAVGKDDFIQTMAAWVQKGFVLIGVREKYGHYCALSQANFFRGLTQCLIIKEDEYEAVSTALKMEFNIGFACYETNEKVKDKIAGRSFNSEDYEDIFADVQYLTRIKAKEIVDDFMDNPIKPVPSTTSLEGLCGVRKCALLLTPPGKKDRTAFEYLQEVAVNFINEYLFYQVDLGCNPQLEEAAKKSSLLVYHPRSKQYLALKAKLSKSTFEKFLKANINSENKKLPLQSFANEKIEVKKCQNKKESATQGEL